MLVDEEERRYFKQQEITLWRKGERVRKLPLANRLKISFLTLFSFSFPASTNNNMRWLGMRQEISQLRGWGNIIPYIFVQYFMHKKSHKKYFGFLVPHP